MTGHMALPYTRHTMAKTPASPPPEPALPLFVQVQSSLRCAILEKRLLPGDKLPSESELEAEFGVSRITVRQALSALHADGLIEKINGKGSFVTRPANAPRLGSLTGFYEHMRARGKNASGRTLSVRTEKASSAVAKALKLEEGTPLTTVTMLRLINGEPIAIGRTQMSPELAQALLVLDLETNDVMSLLESPLGYRLKSTHIEASALKAGKRRGELLQVAPEAPVLCVRFTPHDISDEPLLFSEMYFRADRFAYRAVIQR